MQLTKSCSRLKIVTDNLLITFGYKISKESGRHLFWRKGEYI